MREARRAAAVLLLLLRPKAYLPAALCRPHGRSLLSVCFIWSSAAARRLSQRDTFRVLTSSPDALCDIAHRPCPPELHDKRRRLASARCSARIETVDAEANDGFRRPEGPPFASRSDPQAQRQRGVVQEATCGCLLSRARWPACMQSSASGSSRRHASRGCIVGDRAVSMGPSACHALHRPSSRHCRQR